ncbi:sensor histidine kinase [Methylobacterium komagatae]|uniref:histidine kinase n=1 Tax=Methylobacterium komagatae TaxID=374425 RepID=A0ABW2BJU8_9HYPH
MTESGRKRNDRFGEGEPEKRTASYRPNRLIALGKSHDLLLGGSLSKAPLRSVIENAVEIHQDRLDRFVIDGPLIMIGSRAALSLALMLHELATNAAKYGALSNASGRVTIDWQIDGDGEDASVTVRWAEAGGPPVEAPTRTGFGTRLIARGLAGSFDGEVDLRYPPTGVVCTIVAPQRGLMTS